MILLARSGESLSVWYLVVACCINEQVFVSWKYHSSIQEDKRNWIGCSIIVFFDGSITALIMLSFSLYSSSTMLIFHLPLPLCLLSPFIYATSSIAISMCLWLFFVLCLSHKYSLFHQFKAAFLQCLIYRCVS